jgi:hypothetical protein
MIRSHAIMGQLLISSANMLMFFMLSYLLSDSETIVFINSIAFVLFAYAVAELGASYVAPRLLEDTEANQKSNVLICFILVSQSAFLVVTTVAVLAWSFTTSFSEFDIKWCIAYGLMLLTALASPAWVFIHTNGYLALLWGCLSRFLLLAYTFVSPESDTVLIGGAISHLILLGLLVRQTSSPRLVLARLPEIIMLLKEVFFSRVLSYGVYAGTPIAIAAIGTPSAVAVYIFAERLKALIATAFQPVIQYFYLKIVAGGVIKKPIVTAMLIASIALVSFIITIFEGPILLAVSPPVNFTEETLRFGLWASASSVCASIALHFYIFPEKKYSVFRQATFVQCTAFLALIVLFYQWQFDPVFILFMAEFIFLAAMILCFQWANRNSVFIKWRDR